jgi:hypothetical protein
MFAHVASSQRCVLQSGNSSASFARSGKAKIDLHDTEQALAGLRRGMPAFVATLTNIMLTMR